MEHTHHDVSQSQRCKQDISLSFQSGALSSIGLEKGGEENAKNAAAAIRNKIRSGTGKCIISACLDTQEAESTVKGDLSIFTYYLLGGLSGLEAEYVDPYGNVTTHLLGQYVYDKITSLPKSERPKQIPIIKTEISGDIILATVRQIAKLVHMSFRDIGAITNKAKLQAEWERGYVVEDTKPKSPNGLGFNNSKR
jgi:hypothetical protein